MDISWHYYDSYGKQSAGNRWHGKCLQNSERVSRYDKKAGLKIIGEVEHGFLPKERGVSILI